MRLPYLSELTTSRDMIDVFGGYNHNLRISEGEFYDMKNLTSSYYPVLAPRKQRGTLTTLSHNPVGLIEKDALCYVYQEGTELFFVMNGEDYNLGVTCEEADTERTLVSMGAYVVILPDKKFINTHKLDDKGDIEATYTSPESTEETPHTVKFQISRMDGTVYEVDSTSPSEPEPLDEEGKEIPIKNGYVWLDTSNTPASLKVYSETNGIWSPVATTYIRITAPNLGAAFKEYDGVKISNITVPALEDLNNTMAIYSVPDENSIVVIGLMDSYETEQSESITVERVMPEMDFVIESNNRLWGCKYGLNRDGEVVNELYACKLGDFKNWNCFMGISTDSYAASLGTDGQFTGAFSYLGYPIFFKENCLHTVYGNYPAEYQIQDTACRGVQKGSSKSLAMVNEILYYKSRTGICAFSGSLPSEVGSVLGDKSYSEAVACAHKGKYYISMKDASDGKYALFVCDTEKGLWHKEDDLQVKWFCSKDEELYYLGTEKNTIKKMFGSCTNDDRPIQWMAETGILGCSSPDKKYVSRISMRLSMDIGARVVVSIQYDSSGEWDNVCSLTGHNLRTFTLPIRPKRCDHFRLRIEGVGDVKIFSITKITEQGSDM